MAPRLSNWNLSLVDRYFKMKEELILSQIKRPHISHS